MFLRQKFGELGDFHGRRGFGIASRTSLLTCNYGAAVVIIPIQPAAAMSSDSIGGGGLELDDHPTHSPDVDLGEESDRCGHVLSQLAMVRA